METKKCFTLAEVLITLGIIGIVAAITLPGLMTKINDAVEKHQKQVITTRFVDGLNLFNSQEYGLSQSYANTYDFLKALSAHYKMTTICDANNLTNCLPYNQLNYESSGTEDSIAVSEIKTKMEFPQNFLEPAGFISASGTPFIVAFSNDCGALDPDSIDPDKKMSAKDNAITPCISGIYDLNGTKSPNKLSKDVVSINGAKISKYLYSDGNIKILSVYKTPGTLNESECQALNLPGTCWQDGDRWAWAMKQCKQDGGSLPSREQLSEFASKMYLDGNNNPVTVGTNDYVGDNGWQTTRISGFHFNSNSELAKFLDLDANSATFTLWSSEASSASPNAAMPRVFYNNATKDINPHLRSQKNIAVCVATK